MKWLLLLIPAAIGAVVIAKGRKGMMKGLDIDAMVQKLPEGAPPR